MSSECDSDASTLGDGRVSEKEAEYVFEAIKKRDAGKREVVIGVVHRENLKLLSRKLNKQHRGLSKSTPIACSIEHLRDAIRSASNRWLPRKLTLIVSPLVSEINFSVQARFKRLTITRCEHDKFTDSHLSINARATYCGIPLVEWPERRTHGDHHLDLRKSVSLLLDLSGDKYISGAALLSQEEAARIASHLAQLQKGTWETRKGTVATILGVLTGLGVALHGCIVKVSAWGVYIKLGGILNGISGGFWKATASAVFGAGIQGVAAGVAAAALVYFIPWPSLFKWIKAKIVNLCSFLVEKFNNLVAWVRSYWNKESETDSQSVYSRQSARSRQSEQGRRSGQSHATNHRFRRPLGI